MTLTLLSLPLCPYSSSLALLPVYTRLVRENVRMHAFETWKDFARTTLTFLPLHVPVYPYPSAFTLLPLPFLPLPLPLPIYPHPSTLTILPLIVYPYSYHYP